MSRARPLATLLCKPPERHALAFGHRGARDWQRLVDEVAVLATAVRVKGGGAWLIASDDAYEVALGLLATLHAGGIALLPASLQPGHLNEIGADGLLAGEAPPGCRLPVLALRDLDPDAKRLPLAPLDVERAEVRLHTSGTTGAPVAVRKPLRCLDAEIGVLDRLFAQPSAGPVLGTVPPYHIYGLLFRVLWPLAVGRGMARDRIRFPGELLAVAREVPGALLVSSPAFLKRALPVLNLAELGRYLGGVFSSGGPLPTDVAAAYNRSLVQAVVEVYGSTETGGIGWRSVMDAAAPPPWAPLPGVRIRTDEESGVLMVASPFLPAPGWHRTGDRAALLADGRFELRGRVDRIVKIEERRVSLAEVEQRLRERPEVAAARVLLLAAGAGERLALGAVVVPNEVGWRRLRAGGKEALRASLLEPLRPHLDNAALPRRWRFVRRLPESAQGKTSAAALAALFEAPLDGGRPSMLACTECEDGAGLSLYLPPGLCCFDGHFEGAPILPGVVQVDWAMRFAQERFGLVPQVLRIEALKFFEVISAGATVDLELGYNAEAGRLRFSYKAEKGVCSSGRIQLRAAS